MILEKVHFDNYEEGEIGGGGGQGVGFGNKWQVYEIWAIFY